MGRGHLFCHSTHREHAQLPHSLRANLFARRAVARVLLEAGRPGKADGGRAYFGDRAVLPAKRADDHRGHDRAHPAQARVARPGDAARRLQHAGAAAIRG